MQNMIERDVRECFRLFVNFMRTHIKNLDDYDYKEVSLEKIIQDTNILYMQYIVKAAYSIQENCVGLVAYNHLKSMFEQISLKEKCVVLERDIKLLNEENAYLRDELLELRKKIGTTIEIDTPIIEVPTTITNNRDQINPKKKNAKGWIF